MLKLPIVFFAFAIFLLGPWQALLREESPHTVFARPNPLGLQNNTLLFEQINNATYVSGASAIDVTEWGGETFVVAAQQRDDAGSYRVNSTIFRVEGQTLMPVVSFPTKGAVDVTWMWIDDLLYLFVGNANDGETVNLNSTLYQFDGQSLEEVQQILTHSVGHVSFFFAQGAYHLMVPNSNDGVTPYINSVLYRWEAGQRRFVSFMTVPTQGALSSCYQHIEGEDYILIGNAFGTSTSYLLVDDNLYDRQSFTTHNPRFWTAWEKDGVYYAMVANYNNAGQYLINSDVYEWITVIKEYRPFAPIQTEGAVHLEHFVHGDGEHYVHASNSRGNTGYQVDSMIHRQTSSGFVEEQRFAGKGRSAFKCFGFGNELRCLAGDNFAGQTHALPLVMYEETLLPWVPPTATVTSTPIPTSTAAPTSTPSASITPTPSKKPASGNGGSDLSDGEWVGIVFIIAVVAAVITGWSVYLYYQRKRRKENSLLANTI